MQDRNSFSQIWFALVAAAVIVLPGMAGYLYFSHTPLTPDQLIEVTGHAVRWEVERHQAPGKWGGPATDTTDLTIYTSEQSRPYFVSDVFFGDPDYFNNARFQADVKQGDELVFLTRRSDAGATVDAKVPLYGLASRKAVYLNKDRVIEYDMQKHQTSLFLFIGSLVLLAMMLAVVRMLWRDRKRQRK